LPDALAEGKPIQKNKNILRSQPPGPHSPPQTVLILRLYLGAFCGILVKILASFLLDEEE